MSILDNKHAKKQLLDILAYMLWTEGAAESLGSACVAFCIELYKEVIADLNITISNEQVFCLAFDEMDFKCRCLGEISALEKRLELIEEKLEQNDIAPF